MNDSDLDFMLEAIDQHYAYKFKAKSGFEFWICRDTRLLPEGEVGFTKEEFAQFAHDPDPSSTIKAKMIFKGSKIIPNLVETVKTGVRLHEVGSGRPSTARKVSEANHGLFTTSEVVPLTKPSVKKTEPLW